MDREYGERKRDRQTDRKTDRKTERETDRGWVGGGGGGVAQSNAPSAARLWTAEQATERIRTGARNARSRSRWRSRS